MKQMYFFLFGQEREIDFLKNIYKFCIFKQFSKHPVIIFISFVWSIKIKQINKIKGHDTTEFSVLWHNAHALLYLEIMFINRPSQNSKVCLEKFVSE